VIPFALIVTADDFGIGVETSRGIIQAHLQGPVTATSMMTVTGDHARASVELLSQAPNLDVGLHLVLTNCGAAPLCARRSSGLLNRHGQFLSNAKLWAKAFLKRLNPRAVADEIAAQAQMFQTLLGRRPDYVDCHHHAHQLPIVREALLEVMRHELLPRVSRITVEPPQMLKKVHSAGAKRRAANFLGRRAAEKFSQAFLWSNEYYFGMLSPHDLRSSFPWKHYLENLKTIGVVEWIVHPGLDDPSLIGRDSYQRQRVTELNALTSPEGIAQCEPLRRHLARKSVLAPHPQPL
jgi:predicted glycoside hydrolase/deacetylase ChbG (UPF0249 family)